MIPRVKKEWQKRQRAANQLSCLSQLLYWKTNQIWLDFVLILLHSVTYVLLINVLEINLFWVQPVLWWVFEPCILYNPKQEPVPSHSYLDTWFNIVSKLLCLLKLLRGMLQRQNLILLLPCRIECNSFNVMSTINIIVPNGVAELSGIFCLLAI